MPPPPTRVEVKNSLASVSSAPTLRVDAGLTGLRRTRASARRTPSGSPLSLREAVTAFEPSVAAFLATFDLSLLPLAGPLAAAEFTSVADLARFASFEPDTRMAVLDTLRTADGDRVVLDVTAVDQLEDALAATEWIKGP